MPKLDRETLRVIAELVQGEKCILFLGAGANAPTTASPFKEAYPEAEQPMLGRDLTVRLASRLMASDKPLALTFQKECQDRYKQLAEAADVPVPALRDEFAKLAQTHLGEEEESGLRNMLFASLPNLARVALFYEKTFDRNRLMDDIAGAVQGDARSEKKPSPALRRLAELPFPIVITTNYDILFETALTLAGKPNHFKSVYKRNDNFAARQPTDDPDDEPSAQRPLVLKIHGDIVQEKDSIVITDEDYIQFVLRMRDEGPFQVIPQIVLSALHYNSILFIGYRMMDYNLRLLLKTIRWTKDQAKRKPMYTVVRTADPLLEKIVEDNKEGIDFIVEDVWSFVPQLYKAITGKEMAP